MNIRSLNPYDDADDVSDPNHVDRTLRALEGRVDDDYLQMTPPDSAGAIPDGDNTADIFMRIAGEDSARQLPDEERPAEEQTTVVSVQIPKVRAVNHLPSVSQVVPLGM